MELEFSRQISERYSDVKFYENPSNETGGFSCGLTEGMAETKLIVAFRTFANAPETRERIKVTKNYKHVLCVDFWACN
jgi:hypothetical protein